MIPSGNLVQDIATPFIHVFKNVFARASKLLSNPVYSLAKINRILQMPSTTSHFGVESNAWKQFPLLSVELLWNAVTQSQLYVCVWYEQTESTQRLGKWEGVCPLDNMCKGESLMILFQHHRLPHLHSYSLESLILEQVFQTACLGLPSALTPFHCVPACFHNSHHHTLGNKQTPACTITTWTSMCPWQPTQVAWTTWTRWQDRSAWPQWPPCLRLGCPPWVLSR